MYNNFTSQDSRHKEEAKSIQENHVDEVQEETSAAFGDNPEQEKISETYKQKPILGKSQRSFSSCSIESVGGFNTDKDDSKSVLVKRMPLKESEAENKRALSSKGSVSKGRVRLKTLDDYFN